MADTKLADLTALTTPSGDDILYVVDDPAGTPLDRKMALNNLFTRGTITADAPVINASQTWNNAGVTFTGLKFNAINTASAASSLLIDLQVDGVSRFKIDRTGLNTIFAPSGAYGATTSYNNTSNSPRVQVGVQGSTAVGVQFGSSAYLTWSSDITPGSNYDLFLTRRAAANLRLGAADAGATTATVTITIATPGVVTWTGHTLSTGTPVVFTTTGALPTGITSGTTYYAVVVDTNTFQIASSVANAIAATPTVITTSGSQSGTHTGTRYNITQRLSMQSVTGVTDRLGADLIITGAQGTGTGAGGSIIFQVAPAGGTGTAQNALITALTIEPGQGNATFANSVIAGATATLGFNLRTLLASSSSGVLRLTNNAINDFDRLQFGGTTSSFPALKRSTTFLQARLADDSAFAGFASANMQAATAYTVATLPGTPGTGMIARVTDALAPTIGSTVVGGGAAYALVNYNGANWTVIGV